MHATASLVLSAGAIIVAASVLRRTCLRTGIQPLVGFILLGLLLQLGPARLQILPANFDTHLDFLGQLGVIILLFKVGLEANITSLLAQFRGALLVWTGDVLVASVAGFVTAYYLLELGLLPSLFTAVALSATSIGISTSAWQDAGRLDTPAGNLVLDVAELDDLSAILLMAALFTIVPVLAGQGDGALLPLLGHSLALMAIKLAGLLSLCYLFAVYVERRFTAWFLNHRGQQAAAAVATAGVACLIAGFAEWIGFSIAIGALLAGLAFSRDPAEFQIDRQLAPVYELLSPFFFIAIGFSFDLGQPSTALGVAAALLLAAAAGKLIGAGLPATLLLGPRGGLLVGLSMVPRAEIAMVVILQGARMGETFVPPALLDAMNIVVLVTALATPALLARMLKRGPA